MKYLITFSLLVLGLQSSYSQDTITNSSQTRVPISKERLDSLALHIPQANGSINDFTRLFTDGEVKSLDSLVSAYEKESTIEIVVATVSSKMVKEPDLEDYALVMLRMWGVGKKESNNGILVVISADLRRIRVENGYGIATVLSDAETKQIIDNSFVPKFKEGKFFEGTREGIISIINNLKQNGL